MDRRQSGLFAYDGTVVTEEQAEWLQEAVCDSSAPVKIIYGHQPAFSIGPHGSDLAVREMVHPVARDCGVRLVLAGHDHLYERTTPIDGVTSVVSGGGGHNLYACGTPESWMVMCEPRHHFLYVEVTGSAVHIKAVDADGRVFDSLVVPFPGEKR